MLQAGRSINRVSIASSMASDVPCKAALVSVSLPLSGQRTPSRGVRRHCFEVDHRLVPNMQTDPSSFTVGTGFLSPG